MVTAPRRALTMSAPFPPCTNSLMRVGTLLCASVLVGGPALLIAWVRSPLHTHQGEPVEQPIDFDHRHHVRDDGIPCLYCHTDAERSPNAGVPSTEVCMSCHAQIWTDSPLLAPVRRSYFEDEPIHWKRVNVLPDFVFFNHAAHVRQGVGCETCHGRVDLMANVVAHAPLQMKWCLDCHRDPERHLRPPSEVTTMGYQPSEPQRVVGRRIARELDIHPPTYCSGCHR